MGGVEPCDAKFSEKFPCLHNNNTALIKQISLFYTALVIKRDIQEYFTPILLGLNGSGFIERNDIPLGVQIFAPSVVSAYSPE